MTSGLRTLVYPVKDIETAKQVFGALFGATPSVDQPYYVQFDVEGLAIGLDPNGHANGMNGPVNFWQVADMETAITALVAAGATVTSPARQVGGGRSVATLTDNSGNPIGLLHDA